MLQKFDGTEMTNEETDAVLKLFALGRYYHQQMQNDAESLVALFGVNMSTDRTEAEIVGGIVLLGEDPQQVSDRLANLRQLQGAV